MGSGRTGDQARGGFGHSDDTRGDDMRRGGDDFGQTTGSGRVCGSTWT